MWQGHPSYIQNSSGDLIKTMNFDGATIIDGSDGRIHANSFFIDVQQKGLRSKGGSGEGAAEQLSKCKNATTFKISADGGVKEFRRGKLQEVHCGSKPILP